MSARTNGCIEARAWTCHGKTTIGRIVDDKFEAIAECSGFGGLAMESEPAARRMVAAWNALEGISTEDIEQFRNTAPAIELERIRGERAELIEALAGFAHEGEDLTKYSCHIGICEAERCGRCGPVIRARTLLAKVRR